MAASMSIQATNSATALHHYQGLNSEWAGHSLNVLLSIYAKCIDGQEQVALRRIESLLDANAAE